MNGDPCQAGGTGKPSGKDYADLAAKLAALEERMKTRQGQFEAAMERLGNRLLLAIMGGAVVTVAVPGLLIRF